MRNFLGLLQVALIVLKIMGYLTVSWFAVLTPLWIFIGLIVLTIIVASKY